MIQGEDNIFIVWKVVGNMEYHWILSIKYYCSKYYS